jgi:hypothetical protein
MVHRYIILQIDLAVHLQDGSLEQFLAELGVPHDRVDATVQGAIVWRVTPAGRPLIDRRRRSRVERNVHSVTEHLVNECNLTKGANSTCPPTSGLSWSRSRAVLQSLPRCPNVLPESSVSVTCCRRGRAAADGAAAGAAVQAVAQRPLRPPRRQPGGLPPAPRSCQCPRGGSVFHCANLMCRIRLAK